MSSNQLLADDAAALDHWVEERRIMQSGGATIIWPCYEQLIPTQAAWAREAFKDFDSTQEFLHMSDREIVEHTFDGGVPARDAFLAEREKQIQEYIEGPAQPLARRLMDQGMFTFMSNAYGPGFKGIWWRKDALSKDAQQYTTSIITGQSYEITRGMNRIYKLCDPGINVADCLVDKKYFEDIGMPIPPGQQARLKNLTYTHR